MGFGSCFCGCKHRVYGRSKDPEGVVAYHISNPAAYSVDPTGMTPQIEYFNEESLREFINFRPKDSNGILQRFVHPIGRNNSMTRVWWTPNVTTTETRCNNMHMDNLRVSFTRKSVTFDGEVLHPRLYCCISLLNFLYSRQEHEVSRVRLNRPSEARVRAAANTIAAMVQAAMPRNMAIQLMTLCVQTPSQPAAFCAAVFDVSSACVTVFTRASLG